MKPQHATQVLALERFLDQHDQLLKESKAAYNHYTADGVDLLDFQSEIVKKAVNSEGIWTAELATGIGKSIIAARIAVERMADGPVIFVCPSAAALGDLQGGIVNKFARTFATCGKPALFGELNDISGAYPVSFVTPRAFVHAMREDKGRIAKLLDSASCLIVDEAHHFPDDPNEDLRVYGDIYAMADERMRNKLTVAMTGTWERTDRKRVMGRDTPDVRLTVQDAVDLGRCPELYGVQVITDVQAKNAKARGDLYDLHLGGEERVKYYEGVVDCMRATYRRYPTPFAAFARTQADAFAMAELFNKRSKLGNRGMVVLVESTPLKQRKQAVRALNDGELAGFITCAVGEEALDIPRLEVVHLIRRTKSNARNMQAVGRALRLHKDKRRALLVDYQTMMPGLQDKFVGLSCDDVSDASGSRIYDKQRVNGGPLVAQKTYPTGVLVGMSIGEERAVVCRAAPGSPEFMKRRLLQLAAEGSPRPTVPHTERKKNPDKYNLAQRFLAYTRHGDASYDAAFTDKIKELRPDWLESLRSRRVADAKDALKALAKSGADRPASKDPLGVALMNYCTRTSTRLHDPELKRELEALRPDWFVSSVDLKKAELRRRALAGEPKPVRQLRPYRTIKDGACKQRVYDSIQPTDEHRLADLLWRYMTPGSKVYDEAFTEEIIALRPDWAPKRYEATREVEEVEGFVWRGRSRATG